MRYLHTVVVLISATLGMQQEAVSAIGKTSGTFNVSQIGAANYSIPI